MSRLTLRLPSSLHQTLLNEAKSEGVSLNQFIVYSLTRMATNANLAGQRRSFEEFLQQVPEEDAEEALAEMLASRAGSPRS